jgi:predicted nucleic acid-binding protein
LPTSGLPDALVADTNVVLSAVIGGSASRAFGDPTLPPVYAASAVRDELLEWLPQVAAKLGLDLVLHLGLVALLPISWVESSRYSRHEAAARGRMRERDVEDWPSVALALALAESRSVAIWTNDRDLSASGLPTITTARLLAALDRRSRPP